ncbi:MAG: hypothetical protein ABIL58_20070 [Pseudomonadota bacterium]
MITPQQRSLLEDMVHAAYSRGYERRQHDEAVEAGRVPEKKKTAPWSRQAVLEMIDRIILDR